MAPLPWLCPLDPPYNAVGDSVYGVGGGADDTIPLQNCSADCLTQKKKLYLGDRFFRTTADLYRTASITGFQRGLSIFGDGMDACGIVADYNGDAVRGAVLRYDTSGIGKYTRESEISHFSISQVPGRTGLNGIQLTAAWLFHSDSVKISGLSGHGYAADLRTDIHPTISDYYQSFAVTIERPWIENCGGNGIDFAAGQSPGLFDVRMGTIIGNKGRGIRSTTGQCRIIQNVISYNGVGGIEFNEAEGPSMVACVEQNEIQDNLYWGMNISRSRGLRLIGNRFLAQTYSNGTLTGVPQNGGPFMRSFVHVNLGSGTSGEVYNLYAYGNHHRTVNGPIITTATCYAYDASAGSLSAAFPCKFDQNDCGPKPYDGITQNSTGFGKYIGPMPGATQADP